MSYSGAAKKGRAEEIRKPVFHRLDIGTPAPMFKGRAHILARL
jgi:hypothetical protein